MINISHIEKNNYVNGNGCRYVIWMQGCNFKCEECWNKHTWSSSINKLKNVNDIFNEIISLNNISGVTFTGGEPLLQAEELFILATLIKERTNLGLHIFTGFEIREKRTEIQNNLLNFANTVVFGRFSKSKLNNNQTVVNTTSDKWSYNNSDIEIDIDEDSNVLVTGYPSNDFINKLKEIDDERIYNNN